MTSIFTRSWVTRSGKPKTAYRVTFTANGKKKFRQFTKRKDAQEFVENLSVIRPRIVADSRPTPMLRHVANDWLAACAKGRDGADALEPETIENYRGHVDNYIVDALGNVPVGKLTKHELRAFRDDLVGSALSRSTALKIFGTLKRVIQHAVDLDHLETHPGLDVRIKNSARRIAPIEIPEAFQITKMLDHAVKFSESSDGRVAKAWKVYRAMMYLLVGSGVRLSECRGLRRKDVGPDFVHVRQRADRRGVIGPPKSVRGIRKIYIADNVARELHAFLATHDHDLVFPSRSGEPMDPQNIIHRMWGKLCESTGTTGCGIHSLRHFYASRLIAAGVNVMEVSRALGHADEGFTLKTYGHLFHDEESIQKRKRAAETVFPYGNKST